MFGFILGTACLIGLVGAIRRRRWAYGYGHGCGRGWGGGPWRGGWHGHHHGRGLGPLGRIFSRLETTPEQQKVIRDEIDGLFETFGSLRREVRLSRDDVAKAMRAESFDADVMGEAFGRQDERLDEVRQGIVGALARIHDALDERQRKRLANILEAGPGWGFAGPYRT